MLRQQKNDDSVMSLPEMVPCGRCAASFKRARSTPLSFAKSKRLTWSFLLGEPDSQSKKLLALKLAILALQSRVADGTRTRNNQNHNLGLYH
jgi:hypothetical protein